MTGRHIVTSVAIGMIVIGLVGVAKADEENSGFWVEKPRLDLGDVTAGKAVDGTFVFHNDTDADVKIIRAKPS